MTTKSSEKVKPTVKITPPIIRGANGKLKASPALIAHASKYWETAE
jgi:hypothetical protein